MFDWISKDYSEKKHREAHERQLRKSLAEKISRYDESFDNPTDNFTEIFVDGQGLRVAVEDITITGDLTGPIGKYSKDGGCSMPAEKRELDVPTPLHYSPVEESPRIDSAIEVSKQISRDCQDDTKLDIEGIEDNISLKLETIDLAIEQGQQIQIDIVLEKEPHKQDSDGAKGNIDREIEDIERDERRAPVIFDSDCDYPSHQPRTIEILFDDEFVVLNGEYLNSIMRFHLDQAFQPDNVRTWGPKLIAKKCMQLAKQGNHKAQFRLGCMYAMGFGVMQNYLMAYTWTKVSASQVSSKASLRLKEIETNLTTAHIDYAKQLSKQYYARYVAPYLTLK